MKQVNTKFGTLYIEDRIYDRHNPAAREEADRIKIYDSNMNYLDYISTDDGCTLTDSEEFGQISQEEYDICVNMIQNAKTVEGLLDLLGVDYEFIGTKDETIAYLHNELNWDLPREDYNPLDNEWINKIGDHYIVVSEY